MFAFPRTIADTRIAAQTSRRSQQSLTPKSLTVFKQAPHIFANTLKLKLDFNFYQTLFDTHRALFTPPLNMFFKSPVLSALVAINLIPTSSAHSWIEEYQIVGPKGNYIGDRGFSRGYIGREDPTFDGSFNSLWLLPQSTALMPDDTVRLRINGSDPVCRPSQQGSNYTNPEYPKLKAAPGDFVAAKYLENGHVTLPWNQPGKPPHGGTVYVFGTAKKPEVDLLVDVLKWTKDGKGGNRQGRLLTAQNFDDNRCHQINDCINSVERQGAYPNEIPGQPGSVSELWCETDFQLPEDLESGDYTTYWVWQWPTLPGMNCGFPEGKDEFYTVCADHEIIARGADDYVKLADAPSTNTLPGEDFTRMAVSTYKERTAHATYPVFTQNWANYHVNVATTTDAKIESFVSACAGFTVPTGVPPACPSDKWATGTLAAHYSAKGKASAESAWSAWKARTTAPSNAPSSATAAPSRGPPADSSQPASSAPAAPSRSPTADGSQMVTITRVKSVITTWYTSTITLSPTESQEAEMQSPSPHRRPGPPNNVGSQQQDGGYATVTTEAPGRETGKIIGESDLDPGHGLSTVASHHGDDGSRSKLAPADISQSPSPATSSVPASSVQPIHPGSASVPPTTKAFVQGHHNHSSGCKHKRTDTVPLKHVRTTSSAKHPVKVSEQATARKHARAFEVR